MRKIHGLVRSFLLLAVVCVSLSALTMMGCQRADNPTTPINTPLTQAQSNGLAERDWGRLQDPIDGIRVDGSDMEVIGTDTTWTQLYFFIGRDADTVGLYRSIEETRTAVRHYWFAE